MFYDYMELKTNRNDHNISILYTMYAKDKLTNMHILIIIYIYIFYRYLSIILYG